MTSNTILFEWYVTKLCKFQDIITHKYPLTDVVKGLEMVNNSANSIKVVLFPNAEDVNK